jgi:ABC-type sugar transport system ATPase subunit
VQTDGKTIFSAPSFQLELPQIHGVEKKETLLGIRPEIFSVAKEANAGSLAQITGVLTLAERLGSATNYYIDSPLSLDGKLTATAQGGGNSGDYGIGDSVVFSIGHPEVHLFDPETGLRSV